MTREEIITSRTDVLSMAREAGFEEMFNYGHDWVCFTEEIERFFQAAYAAGAVAERDAIIKEIPGGSSVDPQWVCDMIRARGQA